MANRIYVVSKAKPEYIIMWQAARLMGEPIISSWIDDGGEDDIDFTEAWPRYLSEASSATHVVVHVGVGEKLKGGLFEIGAALGAGAKVLLTGEEIPSMRTLIQHPNVHRMSGPYEAFNWIRAQIQ